jgi:DNA invertase Pin-like site-specific DNA recombinase
MTAYGYIRKSVVHDAARMLSPEMQESAIRRLAASNGDEDLVLLSDLDVSGTKRRDRRPGWDELLRAVEEGEATAVYAYSLSRFARSVSQLADFFELCERAKVRVRVDRDQIDTSTATGKLVGNVLASLAQFEADVASERVKDAFAAKRLRDPDWAGPGNRQYGAMPGEDAQVVVDAFLEARSYDGAARLLNDRGVAARLGGAVWHGSTVSAIVRREDPDAVGPDSNRGRGAKAGRRSFRLARLLVCGTCGTRLTGSMDGKSSLVRYYCHRAKVMPHARGWVTEAKVLPLVADEAERAALQVRRLQKGRPEDEAALAALAAKRTRILENYDDGLYDKPVRDARLLEVAEAESKFSTRRWVSRMKFPPEVVEHVDDDGVMVPAGDPGRVNSYLRRLFERVTVDMSEPAQKGPSKWTPLLAFERRDPSMRAN